MNTDPFKKLHSFFLQNKPFHYKRRETILFTKDIPSGVYYITRGYVRSYLISKEGKELTVTLLKPFDFFPLHWVINNVLTSHYFEALTEVEIYRVSKENFLQLLREEPELFFFTTSKMLLRLNDASERLEAAILGNASSKIASMIVFLAKHAGKQIENNQIVIEIPLTHLDIASLIGLTRETVSLEIEKLEKEKILHQKNHILTIHDMKRLKVLSNTDE